MEIIKPYTEIVTTINGDDVLKHVELCGRVCYKSEERITEESCKTFVESLIKRGHESVLEHFSFTVRFVCDRGVSHELVRHRLASWSQESTRYCNYSKDGFGNEITVIQPCFWDEDSYAFNVWWTAMDVAENHYFTLIRLGSTPQEARSVLPNSLKTEVMMTANLREWRHFFRLRCAPAAHPQMRELTIPLLDKLHDLIPVVFDDIWEEVHG